MKKGKTSFWILARMTNSNAQNISSWTCFNIQICDNVTVIQDNIGYLPTVNAPATQMSTVNEILNQSLNIMHSLKLAKIVGVLTKHCMPKQLR